MRERKGRGGWGQFYKQLLLRNIGAYLSSYQTTIIIKTDLNRSYETQLLKSLFVCGV